MWRTNLKIVLIVLGTLGVYTLVANAIPQLQSEVPEELELGASVTTEELVSGGEEVFTGAGGCTACHGLGTRAPNLLGEIGTRCGERVPELDCKAYLHQSLVDPTAYVVAGFQPIMPDMSRTLTGDQVWAVVAFLQSQGGEVTVTAGDIAASAPAGARGGEAAAAASGGAGGGQPGAAGSGGGAAAGGGAVAGGGGADAVALFRANLCLGCHQFRGEGPEVAPPFDGMGARHDADYIRRSILHPNADTAQGYEQFAGSMPPNFGEKLTAGQLETIVRFLAAQK